MEKHSFHGGHSGQFCVHAEEKLEDLIISYIENGFKNVGITEHMPAVNDELMYPDEKQLGYTAYQIHKKFKGYVFEFKRLQKKYSDKINLYLSMETEWVSGAVEVVDKLKKTYDFDYLVGSVHHVADMPIDFSKEYFVAAVNAFGNIEELYKAYYDDQFDMINSLKPEIVGHIDLIRKFDENYRDKFENKEIWERILRNLELIKNLDLTMDINFRPLYSKIANEPYPSEKILEKISKMQIKCIFGDDSHSSEQVGKGFEDFKKIVKKYNLIVNEEYDFIKG